MAQGVEMGKYNGRGQVEEGDEDRIELGWTIDAEDPTRGIGGDNDPFGVDDVPLPERFVVGGGYWRKKVESMLHMESVKLPKEYVACFRGAAKNIGWKATTRKLVDGTVRCWLLDPNEPVEEDV